MNPAKLTITIALLLSTAFAFSSWKGTRESSPQKLPKSIRKELEDMQLILGGVMTTGRAPIAEHTTHRDSALLQLSTVQRLQVDTFMICKHEVTNAEYSEFVLWVRDSIARTRIAEHDPTFLLEGSSFLNWERKIEWHDDSIRVYLSDLYFPEHERFYWTREIDARKLIYRYQAQNTTTALPIYPDTTGWTKGRPYTFLEPMRNMFFWHPAYDHHPVVNVTWQQAVAYCHWKNKQLKKRWNRHGLPEHLRPTIQLPSQLQWEWAAYGIGDSNERAWFPWEGKELLDDQGKYQANFGQIIDENGFIVKGFSGDGYSSKVYDGICTQTIESFAPNGFDLYDMAGNVAEWTSTTVTQREVNSPTCNEQFVIRLDSIASTFTLDDDIPSIVQKLRSCTEDENQSSNGFRAEKSDTSRKMGNTVPARMSDQFLTWIDSVKTYQYAQAIYHDLRVMKNTPNARVVKGGSWDHAPIYLAVGTTEIYEATKSNYKIGFRISLSVPEELVPLLQQRK